MLRVADRSKARVANSRRCRLTQSHTGIRINVCMMVGFKAGLFDITVIILTITQRNINFVGELSFTAHLGLIYVD